MCISAEMIEHSEITELEKKFPEIAKIAGFPTFDHFMQFCTVSKCFR